MYFQVIEREKLQSKSVRHTNVAERLVSGYQHEGVFNEIIVSMSII